MLCLTTSCLQCIKYNTREGGRRAMLLDKLGGVLQRVFSEGIWNGGIRCGHAHWPRGSIGIYGVGRQIGWGGLQS